MFERKECEKQREEMSEPKDNYILDEMKKLFEVMSYCIQEAAQEDPEGSKTWTSEERFEKGSNWAGRHILITEKLNDEQ